MIYDTRDGRLRIGATYVWTHSGMSEGEKTSAFFFRQRPKNAIARAINYVCWSELNALLQLSGLITVG